MKTKKIKTTKRLNYLNKKIIKDDLVFKVKDFVMSINLDVLGSYISNSGRGQHVIPLWIPVAVWVYAYFHGIQSYRPVSELCKKHDDYYWLSCGFEPSPGYFQMWKLRILPHMEYLLKSYQKYLLNNELINKNEILGLDGVKIECWASLKQSKTEKQIDKELEKTESKIAKTEKENDSIKRRKMKLLDRKEELQKRKKEVAKNSNKETEKMRINITSPFTEVMKKRKKGVFQGVNIQYVINKSQLINIFKVTSKPDDAGMLSIMYDEICDFYSIDKLFGYLLADCGYWKISDIKRFDPEKGYKVVIPSKTSVTKKRKRVIGSKNTGWSIEDGFRYDYTNNTLICPMKKPLKYQGVSKTNEEFQYMKYRCSSLYCNICSKKTDCIGKAKDTGKRLSIRDYPIEIKRLISYYEDNTEVYKLRSVINEPVHSQLLNNISIHKLHTLKKEAIIGEVCLLSLIHNMKKIEKTFGNYTPIEVLSVVYLYKFIIYLYKYYKLLDELKFILNGYWYKTRIFIYLCCI